MTESFGPTSGHWKRMARKAHTKNEKEEETLSSLKIKRKSQISLEELDANNLKLKRSKKIEQGGIEKSQNSTDGGVAVATEQRRRAR